MSKPTTLTDLLRHKIRKSRKSVTALARDAKLPQPVLYRFVTGETSLTLRNVEKLLTYFDLEVRSRQKGT